MGDKNKNLEFKKVENSINRPYLLLIALIALTFLILYVGYNDIDQLKIQGDGLPSDEYIQSEFCSKLCNNMGNQFSYYGVAYNSDIKNYQCYCTRKYYVPGVDNTSYYIEQTVNYGVLLNVTQVVVPYEK